MSKVTKTAAQIPTNCPSRSVTTHAKGGFYHDCRFVDLAAVVEHCNQFLKLSLSDAEERDLIGYLESLQLDVGCGIRNTIGCDCPR